MATWTSLLSLKGQHMPDQPYILTCNRNELILLKVFTKMQGMTLTFDKPIELLGAYEIKCTTEYQYKLFLKVLEEAGSLDEEP